MTVPYEDLDPGIRQVVRWLNDNDFTTHDSGDGKAKFQEDGETPLPGWKTDEDQGFECVMPFPHVIMSVPVADIGPECDRLRDLLLERDLPVGVQGPEEEVLSIQGSYDPMLKDHPAYVMLFGLSDSMLAGVPTP
jgi:hypothetical protein